MASKPGQLSIMDSNMSDLLDKLSVASALFEGEAMHSSIYVS